MKELDDQTTGRAVKVAIVDTGIEPNHPKIGRVEDGIAISLDANDNVRFVDDWRDRNGHGSACAGIIRRIAPEARLFSVRVLDEGAMSSTRLIIEAIGWAMDNAVHLINLSVGSKGQLHLEELEEKCEQARKKGIVVIAAESNDQQLAYPAGLDSVISVGAANTKGIFHYYRDPTKPHRFLGHAGSQRVAWRNGEQRFTGGTSFAASQLTGLVALLKQRNPAASVEELIEELGRYGEAARPDLLKLDTRAIGPEVSSAVLVESDLPMRRVALYPFSKEMHALVRFHDLLSFDIVRVIDPLGHGAAGRDTGEVLGIGATGLNVSVYDSRSFDGIDGLVLGHMQRLQEVRRSDIRSNLLQEALRHRLHVFSFDPLDDVGLLADSAKTAGLLWQWPHSQVSREILLEGIANINTELKVPVLGVFGTRSGQGKFTAQLALRRILLNAGYRVGQLGTEPHSQLFGCDAVFPMGYNPQVHQDHSMWIPHLRHQMLAISQHRDPEIILVGSQSGTIPRDPHLRYEYLCLNSQLFLYGTRPDAVMLAVEPVANEEEIGYTRDTISALSILGKTEVIGLFFSDRVAEDVPHKKRKKRTRHRYMSVEERKESARRLESTFGLPAACPTQKSDMERVYDLVIDFFGQK